MVLTENILHSTGEATSFSLYSMSGFQNGTQEQHEDEIKPRIISRKTYRGSGNLTVGYRTGSQVYQDGAAESGLI